MSTVALRPVAYVPSAHRRSLVDLGVRRLVQDLLAGLRGGVLLPP